MPRIVSRGKDRGAWFKEGVLYVANEDTSDLPDLVDTRRFDKLLEHMASPPTLPKQPPGKERP